MKNKVEEAAVAVVHAAKDELKSLTDRVELKSTPYVEAKGNVTVGLRAAGKVEGIGLDFNLLSSKVVEGKVSVDKNESKATGDYLGKDGEHTVTSGMQVGAGAEPSYNHESAIKDGHVISTDIETSGKVGGAVALQSKLEGQITEQSKSLTVKSGGVVGGAFGGGVTFSGSIEFGLKSTITIRNKEN